MTNITQETFQIQQISFNETSHTLHPYIEFSKGIETLLVNDADNLNFYYDTDFISIMASKYEDLEITISTVDGLMYTLTVDLDYLGNWVVVPDYAWDLTYTAEDFIDFCEG